MTTREKTADHAELARIEEAVVESLRVRGMRSAGTPAIQDVFDALDEWKGIADQEFAARTGAREEATKYKRLLSDLLCIIHRDGGHRIEDVGIEAAADEAIKISAALLSEIAALKGERDAMVESLKDATTVHVNMLRGGIAKPPPCNIGHLYRGADAVSVVAEVMRQNPEAFPATQAERQRDEAYAVLIEVRDVPYMEQEWPRSRALNFLANQGADHD